MTTKIGTAEQAPEYRAANLPEGSVVAGDKAAWIKVLAHDEWRGTNGGIVGDWRVDNALAEGAQVLRVGTGREGHHG